MLPRPNIDILHVIDDQSRLPSIRASLARPALREWLGGWDPPKIQTIDRSSVTHSRLFFSLPLQDFARVEYVLV